MSVQNNWNNFTLGASAYFEKNRKMLTYMGGALIAIVGLFVFYKVYWQPKRENAAAVKLAKLQHFFETDSFDVVLSGLKSKKITSAPEIADNYGLTLKGKEAALMAGIAYLKTGKYEKSLKYLEKTDAKDNILASEILSMKAGCYAELGKPGKAAAMYEKAAETGQNDFTAKYYKKAGIFYEIDKNYKSALRAFEKLKIQAGGNSEVPEAVDVDKYIYKMKALLGEFDQ